MKKVLISAAALMLALTGCAAKGDQAPNTAASASAPTQASQPQRESITVDSAKAVAYACGPQGKEKINVQYGIKGNDIVVAIVNFRNQNSPLLKRDTTDAQHTTFTGEGIMWSANKATPATITQVNAGGLAQMGQDGKPQVLANACKIDKKATAALAKAATQPAAATK